ncbi:hypothetical protein PSHT_11650 [Puccinia striiformis]|uniref:Uncharacterized protein n=1 Tax=Puccinia striiformis TaxID=27350 RepID=A0A2S4V1Z8_9BASI|nr:hypothetical protein PSHT_11650 [Puccinia striiformis]
MVIAIGGTRGHAMAANTSKSSSNNQVVYSAGRSTKGQGNTEENLPSTKKNLTPRSETSTYAAKFTFQTTGPQFPKTPSARFPWSCTLPALGQPASALQYSCFSEAPNTDLARVHGHIGVSVTGKTWAELIKLCMAYAFLKFCYDIYHHCGYHMPILEFQVI